MHIGTAWLLYQRSLSDDDWYSTTQRYLTQNAREKHIKKSVYTHTTFQNTLKRCAQKKLMSQVLQYQYM